jgi:hypothetical protein
MCSNENMALSSDETIKREIIDHIGHDPYGYEARVFFEGSNDDQKLFEDGGLTFRHDNESYGSCDCVYVEQKGQHEVAVLAIEGTDCLSRGSSGNAQYQRLHHALGAVLNGVIGVYYLKTKEGSHKIQEDLYGITYKMSKVLKTPYLVTDDLDVIKNILNYMRSDPQKMDNYINNYLEISYKKFLEKFNTMYQGSWHVFGKKRSTVIFDDYVVKYSARKYRDFTDSSQRGGHIALNELTLTKYYFIDKKVIYLWPRMYLSELNKLNEIKKNDKEWSMMSNDKNVVIATMDDLINIPSQLKEKLVYLRDKKLILNPYSGEWKDSMKTLHDLIQKKEINISERVLRKL